MLEVLYFRELIWKISICFIKDICKCTVSKVEDGNIHARGKSLYTRFLPVGEWI